MFRPNFCIILYPFVKKEIVTLLLNRNTEVERFLGGVYGHIRTFLSSIASDEFLAQYVGLLWDLKSP